VQVSVDEERRRAARGAQGSTPRALAELQAEAEAEVEDVDAAGRGRAVAAAARGLLAAETMGAAAVAAEAAAEEQRWLRLEAETHDKALREELAGEVDRLEQLRNEADAAAEAVLEVEAQVKKTPSWPRNWANFSLLQLHSHWNAPLGQLAYFRPT
jgi:hypothetical protein